jgi:hypothetical protein
MLSDSTLAAPLILPCCTDLLFHEIKSGVYGPARAGPHVLGREKAVLLRQGQYLLCYDTFEHLLYVFGSAMGCQAPRTK